MATAPTFRPILTSSERATARTLAHFADLKRADRELAERIAALHKKRDQVAAALAALEAELRAARRLPAGLGVAVVGEGVRAAVTVTEGVWSDGTRELLLEPLPSLLCRQAD